MAKNSLPEIISEKKALDLQLHQLHSGKSHSVFVISDSKLYHTHNTILDSLIEF